MTNDKTKSWDDFFNFVLENPTSVIPSYAIYLQQFYESMINERRKRLNQQEDIASEKI